MTLINSSYNWYALYTRSRYEKKLHQDLLKRGVEAYLPLKTEKRKWSDRVKVIEEPLLRGYVFVKVSNREYFDVVNNPGAVCYVSFDGKAAAIPENQIDALRLFVDHFNDNINVTRERISKGDIVKVKDGLLKGVHGEVVEIRGAKRIVLRFNNLGYCIHTDISLDEVEFTEKRDNE
ncbi:UpxY family transcription antiterminator [Sunxiuqinia elliptica]|uniref:Transcription antitermination factor NusG n=1 Tax=Sunxiuqinia elliptica TaxID=655355 RepID=A0A4R6H3D1_9BACT|nr:UpxY family transcription antiterminator [Sunxiuqinia elliptica]TDO02663.1 transcription antitermination factor NusG [Sunxiuqinia elliptica]TDO58599.1 transcription antitermination factor NusG [Sunxiuqinia elliptica]